jgi:hypothetical protein
LADPRVVRLACRADLPKTAIDQLAYYSESLRTGRIRIEDVFTGPELSVQ